MGAYQSISTGFIWISEPSTGFPPLETKMTAENPHFPWDSYIFIHGPFSSESCQFSGGGGTASLLKAESRWAKRLPGRLGQNLLVTLEKGSLRCP